ncbi:uncharacterized protein K444DRAFT_609640 [Hyaloscypha bicolor E]|uniref:Uncharacterized protein n=1 Tax=Hyaloscypha bicolor E TaxID=1095630 RepID=A0A2J6TLE2_9HELO|nr:uncharacterized protein K444DRAFT_609640 [Hyaloscypha bicolor E]PMD63827.1 hypothetical protein K444DRAFT_609640 [Hyaloscypha bicolor E]
MDLHGAVDGEDVEAGEKSLGRFAGKKAHSVVRRCIKRGLPRPVSSLSQVALLLFSVLKSDHYEYCNIYLFFTWVVVFEVYFSLPVAVAASDYRGQ